MGGREDDEPLAKRMKLSLAESSSNTANGLSFTLPPVCFLREIMPQPSCRGEEVIVGSRGVIKRVEFVRLIAEALYSLGYEKTSAYLEEESGIPLHLYPINLFIQQITDGDWDASINTLHLIQPLEETAVRTSSLLILEQKFFELLERGKPLDALTTLRTEITPLCFHDSRVRKLSSFLICLRSDHDGDTGAAGPPVFKMKARTSLLEELRKLVSPAAMIPKRRLEHLLEQALNLQLDSCRFHNSTEKEMSLFIDHHCGKSQIPSRTLRVLEGHRNEVWFVQFSHNGKYLASSSSDQSAIIWEVGGNGIRLKHRLCGHEKAVLCVVWSPNDEQILTCGVEESVRRWDAATGECLGVYDKGESGMVSCGWLPDETGFVSGVNDRSICMWDVHQGREMECWKGQRTLKISDLEVTRDGKWLISICRYTSICMFNMESKTERFIEESQMITSFSLSRHGDFLLVNLLNQEIHLWSIDGADVHHVSTYDGMKRARFIIRSCFGGLNEAFIASGSEDSRVYVWHRESREVVETLVGHSGSVNCVCWNPVNPYMLASGSDDRTIRIWGLDVGDAAPARPNCNGTVHC